jgi:hypothetical protein
MEKHTVELIVRSLNDHYWEIGWDEHERLQLQRLARLPLAQKLQWLEEAHRIVLHLAAARRARADDPL